MKQNKKQSKNNTHTREPGIPWSPPNYTKNRKVRDLLDTPDPKDEMPTIQIQSLKPLKARVQLINTEKTEWSITMGKRVRHKDLLFLVPYERTGPLSEIKKL